MTVLELSRNGTAAGDNAYVVEHNVPLPRGGPGRPYLYPFRIMEVGDSFLVPCEDTAKARESARRRTLHRGVRPVSLAHLRVVERKPVDCFERLAANDRAPELSDPAYGGWGGIVIMVLVAMLIGVLLAAGGF